MKEIYAVCSKCGAEYSEAEYEAVYDYVYGPDGRCSCGNWGTVEKKGE